MPTLIILLILAIIWGGIFLLDKYKKEMEIAKVVDGVSSVGIHEQTLSIIQNMEAIIRAEGGHTYYHKGNQIYRRASTYEEFVKNSFFWYEPTPKELRILWLSFKKATNR